MKTPQPRSAIENSLSASFSFEEHGSALHLKIVDHCDLEEILELDEALWIATTAPVSTLKADEVFLSLLDSDQDCRLRAEEIKDGIRFLLSNLDDYTGIFPANSRLPLRAINQRTELGSRIHTSAMKILKRLQSTTTHIDLAEVRAVKEEVLRGGLDEAGIVLTEAAENEETGLCIGDILSLVGGKEHHNGMIGGNQESIDDVFSQRRKERQK